MVEDLRNQMLLSTNLSNILSQEKFWVTTAAKPLKKL